MNKRNRSAGILTWHYYQNFGSALQCFALQTICKTIVKDVKVINYRNPRFGSVNIPKEWFCYIFAPLLQIISRRFKLANLCFRKKYIKETRFVRTYNDISDISRRFDVIILGSDQIWAPNLLNPVYLGEPIDSSVRKVSYAASIGLNDIPEELVPQYKNNLSGFYAIGIREQEGKDLLKRKCGIESTVVLDPTLLVNVDTYKQMQRKIMGIHHPYLFCYFLNKEHRYKDSVKQYAEDHSLTIVGVSDNIQDDEWMTRLTGLGADHFLWLINHAATVMTDSYHGSIFSLLFHKNLWIFQRFSEDNPICQNSRIRQLSHNFDLDSRIITATSIIDDSKPIDFNAFEARLNELKNSSMDFLKKALE